MRTDDKGMDARSTIISASPPALLALVLIAFALAGMALGEEPSQVFQTGVVINEVCASNTKSLKDADTESPDWIELYNNGGEQVNLRGYKLTDDVEKPDKFEFGSVSIDPYDYLIVFASKKRDMLPELHADFRLSSEGGESVYLLDPEGSVVSEVALVKLDNDTCYARRIDGFDEWERLSPTPRESNNTAKVVTLKDAVAPVEFSLESGFYDGDMSLELSACDGCRVYYTLDGSDPDESSALYAAPITLTNATPRPNVYSIRTDLSAAYRYTPSYPVDKCEVVRAVAVDENGQKSAIATNSYFIGLDREEYKGVSVISLVSDPSNLFDYEKGIYVTGAVYDEYLKGLEQGQEAVANWEQPANYRMKGREWEREACLTYFDQSGNKLFSQQIGVRVHGQASRLGIQKSLRLYARKEYDGNKAFKYNWFDNVTQTKTVLLRSGGSDASYSKIRDVFFQSLAEDRDVVTQKWIPCIVFINGEYWGLYNLQQRTDKHYIEGRFGIDDEFVVTANAWGIKDGLEEDNELFSQLKRVIALDLSEDDNYKEACSIIDAQSLIDHFCAEIFSANWDWPINNIELWRSRTVTDRAFEDGVWRYKLIDMDYSGAYNKNASYEFDTYVRAMTNEVFAAMMANASFRERFVLTMTDMINFNFVPEKTVAKLDEVSALYAVHMDNYFKRFISSKKNNTYAQNISAMREFLLKRPNELIKLTKSALALKGEAAELTLSVADAAMGDVRLNTITPEFTEGIWRGLYFTDYPVTLTAQPREGYAFLRWEVTEGNLLGEAADPTVRVRLGAPGTTVKAIFAENGEKREVLAAFDYDKNDAARQLTGNASEGYRATDGVYKARSKVYASVNGTDGRKLEWSKEPYERGDMPVMSANGKNRWEIGAYFDFSLSTLGYDNIQLTAGFAASLRGPRDLSLQYSLNGKTYVDIEGADAVLSRLGTVYTPFERFALPAEISNRESVRIRVRVSSKETVRGLASLAGSDEGEVGLAGFSLTGAPIALDYGKYDALVEKISVIKGIPEENRKKLDELLKVDARFDGQTQAGIASAVESLGEALDEIIAFRGDINDFAPYLPKNALENAVAVNLYDGVRDAVGQISMDVSFGKKAYIYRLNGETGNLDDCGEANAHSGRVVFKPTEAGRYLLLDRPAREYQYKCEFSDEPLSREFMRDELLGGSPSGHAFLNVSALVDKPIGECGVDMRESGLSGEVYVYEVGSEEIAEKNARLSGETLTIETTGGRYLILSESIADIRAEQNMYEMIRAREEEKKNEQPEGFSLGKKELIIVGGIGAAALAALIIIIRARGKRRRRK